MFDLQTWHIPSRVDGITPRPVVDVITQKARNPAEQPTQVKKEKSFWCF